MRPWTKPIYFLHNDMYSHCLGATITSIDMKNKKYHTSISKSKRKEDKSVPLTHNCFGY